MKINPFQGIRVSVELIWMLDYNRVFKTHNFCGVHCDELGMEFTLIRVMLFVTLALLCTSKMCVMAYTHAHKLSSMRVQRVAVMES